MSYYAYQNWHRQRALVHLGSCGNCNHGQGKQPKDSGSNGKWHPPFVNRASAVALMQTFG